MVPANFVYLVGTFPLLVMWLIIFFWRKDLRKEILWFSIPMSFMSMITSYIWWTVDWWQPLTVWGTKIGVEDFIVGFTSGGLMAVLYEVIFKKKLYKRKTSIKNTDKSLLLFLLVQLMCWFFYGIGLTSFLSSSISLIVGSILMLLSRRDLITNALASGVLMTVAVLPSYYVIILINSQWVDRTYSMLSGLRVTGIPIEELVFWFLVGFLFGPFYEYWQDSRLRKFSPNIAR